MFKRRTTHIVELSDESKQALARLDSDLQGVNQLLSIIENDMKTILTLKLDRRRIGEW